MCSQLTCVIWCINSLFLSRAPQRIFWNMAAGICFTLFECLNCIVARWVWKTLFYDLTEWCKREILLCVVALRILDCQMPQCLPSVYKCHVLHVLGLFKLTVAEGSLGKLLNSTESNVTAEQKLLCPFSCDCGFTCSKVKQWWKYRWTWSEV